MAALPVNDHIHNDHVEYFLKEENYFITTYSQEFEKIQQWDKCMTKFLRSRREPSLLKLSQVYRQLKDGHQAVTDALVVLDNLIKIHTTSYELTKQTEMFRTKLHEEPNHLPTITSTGQSDESVIQLCAMTTYLYQRSRDEKQLIEDLEDIRGQMKHLLEPINLDNIFKLIKVYADREKDCVAALKDYDNAVQFNIRKRHDFKALTVPAKDRQDVFVVRQKYAKAILKCWKLHMRICRIVNQRVSVLLKTNTSRKQYMSRYLNKISKALLDYETANITKIHNMQATQAFAPYQAYLFNKQTGFFVTEEVLEQPKIVKPYQTNNESTPLSGTTAEPASPTSQNSQKLDQWGKPMAPTAPELPPDYQPGPHDDDVGIHDFSQPHPDTSTSPNASQTVAKHENPYELQVDVSQNPYQPITGQQPQSPSVYYDPNGNVLPSRPQRKSTTNNDSTASHGAIPPGSTFIQPPEPYPCKYNASIKPKPVPNSVKEFFRGVQFEFSVPYLLQQQSTVPPPGPFPEDSTIALKQRGVIKTTFSTKEVTIIYTKGHQLFFVLDKEKALTKKEKEKERAKNQKAASNDPQLAVLLDAEDDDGDDYDKYIKTWGADEVPPFDALATVGRKSRKDQLRLCLKEIAPGKFSRNKEFKIYFEDQNEVTRWIDFINTHNRSGVFDDEDLNPNAHGL